MITILAVTIKSSWLSAILTFKKAGAHVKSSTVVMWSVAVEKFWTPTQRDGYEMAQHKPRSETGQQTSCGFLSISTVNTGGATSSHLHFLAHRQLLARHDQWQYRKERPTAWKRSWSLSSYLIFPLVETLCRKCNSLWQVACYLPFENGIKS